MADKFSVVVKFSYNTLAEMEDDDLGIEVLGLIKARRGVVLPKTADQVLIEQLQARLEKQEADNYRLQNELAKLTKAFTSSVPAAPVAPL